MLNKIVFFCLFLFLFLFLLFPQSTFSQCWPRADKLVPNKTFDNFEGLGKSVDYENNIAAVGAPDSDTLSTGSGVVYVFEFDGNAWNKIAALSPSDDPRYGGFGQTVRISNDHIYVTNPSHTQADNSHGAIYIFKKPQGGWRDMTETSIMTAGDPNARGFGVSLDIFENTMIVGCPQSLNVNNQGIGAAYVFQWQNDQWNKIAKFSSGNTSGNTFGSNVAIRKNLAVVVADEEQIGNSTGIGACYVFEKAVSDPWTDALPIARLSKNTTDQSISYLGYGLAIDENRQTIFIGDNLIYDKTNNTYSKGVRAYIKPSDGWKDMKENSIYTNAEQAAIWLGRLQFEEPYLYFSGTQSIKIFKPDNADGWNTLTVNSSLRISDYDIGQRFGSSLSVKNGHVLAGAPAELTQDRNKPIIPKYPAVYEFIMPATGWTDENYNEKYQFSYMPKTAASFAFGSVVDIDGDYAVVGSSRDNDGGRHSGVAYVYHLVDLEWKKIAILSPSDGEYLDLFGGNVTISENYIAISAVNKHYRDGNGKLVDFNMGAVYVFEKPNGEWTSMNETYKIIKSEGKFDYTDYEGEDDDFGGAIDMDFPYLIVSRYESGRRPNNGSVFVYKLSNDHATLEATLNPSIRNGVNNFGTAVKISKQTIVISSGGVRGWLFDSNMVFVYTKKGEKWIDSFESAVLYPSDVGAEGYLVGIAFGSGIDMNSSGTRIIVGAPGWFGPGFVFDVADLFKGAAYIYEMPSGGWKGILKEKARLTVPNQPAYGCMGVSVHIEDRYAVVGSPQNYFYTSGGSRQGPGRVYFYQMPEGGWTEKNPDKIIRGDEAGGAESDYFGSAVDGVYGFLMIGALADDNQNSVDAGSVYIYSEYPFIYPGPPAPLCENENPVRLSAYPEGGQWTGSGISNPIEGLFDPALAGKGIHQIHYKVDDCDASNTLLIDVREMIKPFSISPRDSIFFCGAPDVTLTSPIGDDFIPQWSYSKAGSAYTSLPNATSSTLKVNAEGSYKVIVSNACSAQSDSVWVGNLYPYAGEGFKTCITTTAVVVNGNYPHGIWSGNGISANGIFSPAVAGLGEHILQYSVSPYEGCLYQDTTRAVVNGIPNLDITAQGANSFCYTGITVLTATALPDVEYQWYYGQSESSLSPLDEISSSLDAHDLGYYKVTALDEGLCFKDAFYELTPVFNPSITPLFDSLSFCYNAPIKIEAQSIPDAHYFWIQHHDNNHHVIGETTSVFDTEIKESGNYSLMIQSHGCEYTSAEMTAHKIPADSLLIPNIITPNGDHKNDTFEIYANEGIDRFYFSVFNRYGEAVYNYEGSNRSTGWSGDNLSPGVYFLTFRYTSACENKTIVYKGTLSILR